LAAGEEKVVDNKQKVIVLISGGMDSVTALYDAARQYHIIAGISFDYGAAICTSFPSPICGRTRANRAR
jgi:tRNA U34 2-thiouridine synthase MnmA/TrmU